MGKKKKIKKLKLKLKNSRLKVDVLENDIYTLLNSRKDSLRYHLVLTKYKFRYAAEKTMWQGEATGNGANPPNGILSRVFKTLDPVETKDV